VTLFIRSSTSTTLPNCPEPSSCTTIFITGFWRTIV
jgi:hypothetical protein